MSFLFWGEEIKKVELDKYFDRYIYFVILDKRKILSCGLLRINVVTRFCSVFYYALERNTSVIMVRFVFVSLIV